MENCEQIIANAGILPVINIPAVELAKPLALSILNGGYIALRVFFGCNTSNQKGCFGNGSWSRDGSFHKFC